MTNKRFYFILVFGLLMSSVSLFAQSDRQKELEAQRQQKLKEIKLINALLYTKKDEEKSVITLIEDINAKVSVRRNLIRITNEQANLLTREINTNQQEISSLRTQLEELKEDYSAMVVKSYKSKSEQSKVMFLLSSSNFQQAYKRLQYIRQYREYQKEQGEAIKSKTKELQALNIQLSKQKVDKQKLVEENRIAKRELEGELKQREILMASIKSDMGKFAAQIKKKKQEADQLDKEIDRIIAEAIAAANKKANKNTSGKTSSTKKFILTPEAKKLAASFAANKGKLGWPVARGVIKGKFGKTRSLTDSSVEVNHSGVKIATEKNAEVRAVFTGVVSSIHVMKRGNPTILIRHGDYLTIYHNLSKLHVKKGDKITTGQVIGEVFSNKITGETLLDFRIYKNDLKLNPESWLVRQ